MLLSEPQISREWLSIWHMYPVVFLLGGEGTGLQVSLWGCHWLLPCSFSALETCPWALSGLTGWEEAG